MFVLRGGLRSADYVTGVLSDPWSKNFSRKAKVPIWLATTAAAVFVGSRKGLLWAGGAVVLIHGGSYLYRRLQG